MFSTRCPPSTATLMGQPFLQVIASPGGLLAERAPSTRLGVTLEEQGSSFRVWAPHAQRAQLELEDGTVLPLGREGDTWAAAFAPGVRSGPWPRTAHMIPACALLG